ncbi:alpha-L-fucosidase [Streptomyces sp. MA15]|uniref:alpha-L-fucosidase n=1 Tax=Streptomyces sp. MA15 TaxID=3055061 RepID=UPI0025AFC7D0|nr:alpha-L-fucosidase [Streptomyces sp. MA15]MDN3270159.1 alpha-L-fucosidase [Streptomyces sp. MA15]
MEHSRPRLNRRQFMTMTAVGAGVLALPHILAPRAAAAPRGTYEPTWESVNQHPAAPEWFQDAKFGIYFHWGVYSVPAFYSEWYPHEMYKKGSPGHEHHIATYGNPEDWHYHNFIDGAENKDGEFVQFAPKLVADGGKFDPEEWAQLFADSGARYAGPVGEHHDGFSMWASEVSEWNAADRGPRLDLVGLLAQAIRARDMKLVISMHHALNATNIYYQYAPGHSDESLQRLYGQLPREQEMQLWLDKLTEVIDKYEPDIIWQDFGVGDIDENRRLEFLAHYYNHAESRGKEVVATCKDGISGPGQVQDWERGGPGVITEPYWLTDDSISSSSWCYTEGIEYYSGKAMLHAFIDRISKNGNLLLNIAPKADGSIPDGQREALLAMGNYLGKYGEAVYATRAWEVFGEGPTQIGGGHMEEPVEGTNKDIRFTRDKANTTLYLTVFGWPGDGAVLTSTTLPSNKINLDTLERAELLGPQAGSYIELEHRQDGSGLHLTMPSSAPDDTLAYVVKLTFSGQIPALAADSGAIVYTHVDYEGPSAVLALGGYTAADLSAAGLMDRSISSVRPIGAFQVVGYTGDNFGGESWTFTENVADLRTSGRNDAIVSVRVTINPTTYVRLENVTSGLVLDSGGDVPAGTDLKQWAWNGSTNLQWLVEDLGDGTCRLVNRTNGMVVDGWGAGSGGPVKQAAWNGGDNQRWEITNVRREGHKIINRGTGMALDGGGHRSSGSPAKQWTWDGSPNLQWRFVPAE